MGIARCRDGQAIHEHLQYRTFARSGDQVFVGRSAMLHAILTKK